MTMQTLIIGTRGSALALKQTKLVAEALLAYYPDLVIKTSVIATKGDTNMSPIPLDTIGKAWFTEEIEQALQKGTIDVAVHSLKDIAPELPEDLNIAAVLTREDPRDVLVASFAKNIDDLPTGAIVGTDSIRRKAALLRLRPDLLVRSIRGNVETRLRKLREEDYDAIVIAAAGLSRLGMLDVVAQFLPTDYCVPAIGQGVLACETRSDDMRVQTMIRKIQSDTLLKEVAAEQVFAHVIGGSCKFPIGCYVRCVSGKVTIDAMLGTMDASRAVVKSVSGPEKEARQLARQLALDLLEEIPSMKDVR